MAITNGSYTIGTGGNYTTLLSFLSDIHPSGVNGNITGTIISSHSNNSIGVTIVMNGYTLLITSNSYHGGYYSLISDVNTNNGMIIGIQNGKIIIEKVSMGNNFYRVSNVYFSPSTDKIIIRNCVINSTLNTFGIAGTASNYNLNFEFCNNTFRSTMAIGYITMDFNYVTGVVENNTFDIESHIRLRNGGRNNITFRNNFFNVKAVGATTTIAKNTGNTINGYNNCTNLSDIVDSFFNSGSGNLINRTISNEVISTTISNSDYYKLKSTSTVKNSGTTPALSYNTTGIRLNIRPHNSYYSIGADEYLEYIHPEKIIFEYTIFSTTAYLPLYPYATIIELPFDKIGQTDGTISILDNGSNYDKRSCQCKMLMTSTEVSDFNTYIVNNYYNTTSDAFTIKMGANSNFFPFGHDVGNIGPFTVKMDIIKFPYLSQEFKGMFEVELKLYLCDTPPAYTFITDKDVGTFQIGTISGLRFPPNHFEPERKQEYINTELESKYITNRVIKDRYYVETKFNLNCNLPKAQRLLNYIVSTNRALKYNISNDSGGYIMGYNDGTQLKIINATLLNSVINIITHAPDRIEMDLMFGANRNDIT